MDKLTDLGVKAAARLGFSPSENKKLVDLVFKQLDKDKDGSIDFHELVEGLKRLQVFSVSETKAKELFKELDKDGDNRISKSEFDEIVNIGHKGLGEPPKPDIAEVKPASQL